MKIKKEIKLTTLGGGIGINIPKVLLEILNWEKGDKLELVADTNSKQIKIKKVEEQND